MLDDIIHAHTGRGSGTTSVGVKGRVEGGRRCGSGDLRFGTLSMSAILLELVAEQATGAKGYDDQKKDANVVVGDDDEDLAALEDGCKGAYKPAARVGDDELYGCDQR